ncbi:bifunctional chorismate mutase/prephenate dehydrogenase [Cysteiniphilum halobium]|uniref:bifunctional chorismate mutase/prephenate dehydrogenase n=1 Tax=Cysteiniphilum halobium TaxID=2219059 RepID=UPI000E657E50|nr:bifunctional chorismate mutase/prephenate dehydrogenase [Cysteiniphilum halobium]
MTEITKKQTRRLCIIGGHGAMGQCLAFFLSQLTHYEITLFDEQDWEHANTLLKNQEIVIISTPIALTDQIIEKASSYIDSETILADLTSIKSSPMTKMLSAHSGAVVGLHPIFGPTVTNANKQVIVYCDGRDSQNYQWFINDLITLGFTLKKMTASAHDQAMTFIQGIEHFSVFCMGIFLKQHDIHLEELMAISSPVYKMELNIIGRLFSQDADLYANIIASDHERLKSIHDYAQLILKQVEQLKSPDGKIEFSQQFNDVKHWMGEFANKAYQESDRLLGIKPLA